MGYILNIKEKTKYVTLTEKGIRMKVFVQTDLLITKA